MRSKSVVLAFLWFSSLAEAQGVHPLARSEFDQGLLAPGRRLPIMTVHLAPSADRQIALDKLLSQQRDRSSPNYHKWLTPEQFADRFGASAEDFEQVRAWLESGGLTIEHRARGRNWIAFSGTASQVKRALGTEFHRYVIHGEEHYANSTPVQVPTALRHLVRSFSGLNDFSLKPRPRYTNSDLTHSLAPGDIAAIYNIAPLYAVGINGQGMKIAIAGGSDISLDDIRAFRAKFSLPPSDPQLVLFGSDPGFTGGQDEGSLDIEWAGAVAPNASIVFVYASDPVIATYYAIDQNLAPVLSLSYAACEKANVENAADNRAIMQQANAQGMTVMGGDADSGAAACDDWHLSPVASNGLAVSLPGSIPEVTSVGGTNFDDSSGNYWNSANGPGGGSASSYIPEIAWNDTAAVDILQASGGGRSVLYPKPAWQTGPGVPADGARDVPDVALHASGLHDGYWFCSKGQCFSNGAGDSFATPVFAGMVVLLNQYLVSRGKEAQPGLGNINPDLYRIAQSNPNGFHDITSGNNIVPCAAGSPDCSNGKLGYAAGPGYDLVTGLGSVDVNNLVTQWSAASASAITLSSPVTTISLTDNVLLSVVVAPASGPGTPTGAVSFYIQNRGYTAVKGQTDPLLVATVPLAAGGASLRVYGGQFAPGSNTILASYSGDGSFDASTGTLVITAAVPTTHSAVLLSVLPNVVEEQPPNVNGAQWFPTLTLTEAAGFGTTITRFMIAGNDFSSQIAQFFGADQLAAHGSLTTNISWQGITAPLPVTTSIQVSGQDASGFQWSQQIPLVFGGPEQLVFVGPGGISNGASFSPGFAPGMVLSVFGRLLASGQTASAPSLPLPTTLSGANVTVNGVPAPFYYASSGQLNVQIPYGTPPGTAMLAITTNFPNGQTQTYSKSFVISQAAPGIFASGGAAVPFASGNRGGTYILFITGEGEVTPSLATGATPDPSTPVANLPAPKLPVKMTIGGVDTTLHFVGIPSGLAGVTQINFTVPSSAPLGVQPVVVNVGGVPSPPVNFTVMP